MPCGLTRAVSISHIIWDHFETASIKIELQTQSRPKHFQLGWLELAWKMRGPNCLSETSLSCWKVLLFFSFFRRLRCDLRRLPKAPSPCPAKWHRITPQRIWNIGLALDPLNSSSYQVISAAKAPCCWCAVQKTHEHVGLLQFLTSKNAVVQSHTPTFPSFQLASASATIACHFGWAPLQDFPIFTMQLCKTSPQLTSKRHDMIWTTKDTMDTSCWKSAAHQIPGFLPRSRCLQWKRWKTKYHISSKKKTQLWNPTKPNGPVASINGWLQCPGGNFAKHIPNTSNEHSKHLSPRPNLAKAQAKTEICRTDSEKWKVEKVSPTSKHQWRPVKFAIATWNGGISQLKAPLAVEDCKRSIGTNKNFELRAP